MPQVPKWKKWLSYLMEFHIESAPSEYNPHLYVSLVQGRYQLSTANAVYSYGDLYDNFVKAFDGVDIASRDIKNVLILGFGLGSIPEILEKRGLDYHYTAVEIDEEVLYLANEYTLPQIKSPIDLVCADAFAWVNMCTEQFDLICMDVFLDDVVPDHLEAIDYLEKLKTLLTPSGMLLFNRLAATKEDVEETKAFFEDKFLSVFPNGRYLDVTGNWILVNK